MFNPSGVVNIYDNDILVAINRIKGVQTSKYKPLYIYIYAHMAFRTT